MPDEIQTPATGNRPEKRDDGIPTRIDRRYWTPAEWAIWFAVQEVERAGASIALTRAVTLLQEARERVADHAEGFAAEAGALPVPEEEPITDLMDALQKSMDAATERSRGE